MKETEKDRKTRAGDIGAVRKHITNFSERQDKYKTLVSKANDEEKYSAAELRVRCSVRKKN